MENQSDNSDEKLSREPMLASPTLLDLTSYQLHDLDSVDLPPSLTELDLTTNRLPALDPRIGRLPNLKKLSLRQNLITDDAVEPLSSWHLISHLEVCAIHLYPLITLNFDYYYLSTCGLFTIILVDLQIELLYLTDETNMELQNKCPIPH